MLSGFLSAGTSFATGLPCFVISTVSLFAWTSSMTARQCILKEPAAILFILELRDHSHYTVVIFANQSELVIPMIWHYHNIISSGSISIQPRSRQIAELHVPFAPLHPCFVSSCRCRPGDCPA